MTMKQPINTSGSISKPAHHRRNRARGNGSGTLFKRGETGPWYLGYHDDRGRRITRSAQTTDKATAQAILNKELANVAKRREGLIDHANALVIDASKKPVLDHVVDYVADCERSGQASHHTSQKRVLLTRLIEHARISRLGELGADVLSRHLRAIAAKGRSARTQNAARAAAVAFGNWCVAQGRLATNPMLTVSTADEARDRRRVRRALDDDELARLLAVADARGRRAWYLAAVLAGLRKGDLQRLTWADVDFDSGAIDVRKGKSGRDDTVPLHPDLAAELLPMRGMPKARVFPTTVTDRTRLGDFLAAGLAEHVPVLDAAGQQTLRRFGKGRSCRMVPVTKVVVIPDPQGKVVDLHAMRTTLGTNLARAGVAPQIAKDIMRHGDYRTTLKHYTQLHVRDAAAAINQISVPAVEAGDRRAAVGAAVDTAVAPRPGASGRTSTRGTTRGAAAPFGLDHSVITGGNASSCEPMHVDALKRAKGVEPSTFSLEG
jgi:integrase